MQKRKINILLCGLLCLGLVAPTFLKNKALSAKAIEAPATSAKAMVLIEENSKRVLAEKNKDLPMPMASTTKIMTAYTVLNRCDNLDTVVKINPQSVGVEGTSMYLKKGQEWTIKDLLYGMMLASGNDASVALALHFSASVEEFALLMNADAHALGLKNANFQNPHGLDQKWHKVSAYDLAVITANAMKFQFFKEMVTLKSALVTEKNTPDKMQLLVNKNKLLGGYKYATGVKIGFTDDAGRCLVSSAEKDGLKLIGVVFNCPDMFMDSRNLLEWGFQNYIYTDLLESYKIHRKVQIENGREKEMKIYSKREFAYPLTLDESFEVNFEYDLPEIVRAPIEKEEVVGTYRICLKDEVLFETELYAFDKIKSIEFGDNLKEILQKWL